MNFALHRIKHLSFQQPKEYTMFFLSLLFSCSSLKKQSDPMCDAICDEINTYQLTKPLQAYSLDISFSDSSGTEDSIQIFLDGTMSNGYAQNLEVSADITSDTITLYAATGVILENIEIHINETTVSSTLSDTNPIDVCGSVCSHNSYNLNTDDIEEIEASVTTVEDINNIISCASSTMAGDSDLTIVASNENYTNALIVHEVDGYDVSGGGYWENGFNNPNLTVELHVGTNVGLNYCTDDFEDEEIAEIYVPIDVSELPEDFSTDDIIAFDYGPGFPECEDCVPYAMVYVENFWFRSEQGYYAKVELINYLQTDILFAYGG
jgi:hypothetical protein